MAEVLDQIECRILGALVEKQLTTPENYPLTLKSLVAACNQKNNRDPVMTLDEPAVSAALERLRERNLVYVFYGSSARVPKYKHMLPGVYELEPAEVAVMAVLMLRGPQTVGELRERSARMHEFDGIGEVQQTLDVLMRRDEPVVAKVEHMPGRKDARYAHLLSGEIDQLSHAAPAASASVVIPPDRVEKLEADVAALRSEVEDLKTTFDEFRKQFE